MYSWGAACSKSVGFREGQFPLLKVKETVACLPALVVGYYTKDLMKIVVTGVITMAAIRFFSSKSFLRRKNERLIGIRFSGLIIDENDQNYFVQKWSDFSLIKSRRRAPSWRSCGGLWLSESKQELVITTEIPKSRQGHYAFGTVTDSRRDLGVLSILGSKIKIWWYH